MTATRSSSTRYCRNSPAHKPGNSPSWLGTPAASGVPSRVAQPSGQRLHTSGTSVPGIIPHDDLPPGPRETDPMSIVRRRLGTGPRPNETTTAYTDRPRLLPAERAQQVPEPNADGPDTAQDRRRTLGNGNGAETRSPDPGPAGGGPKATALLIRAIRPPYARDVRERCSSSLPEVPPAARADGLGRVSKVDQEHAMITARGSGRSVRRSVDGTGTVAAEGHKAWSAAGPQQAPADQRHTVPHAHRHTVARPARTVRAVGDGVRAVPPLAA